MAHHWLRVDLRGATCCSPAGPPTCPATGACSSSASCYSVPPRLPPGLASTRSCWSSPGLGRVGRAIVSPAALALLTTTFPEGRDRNRALGVFGAVASAAGASGLLLGGVITAWAGWRWVFLVNVPIAVAAAVIAPLVLRETRDRTARRLDVPARRRSRWRCSGLRLSTLPRVPSYKCSPAVVWQRGDMVCRLRRCEASLLADCWQF
jgi:MFS family permease